MDKTEGSWKELLGVTEESSAEETRRALAAQERRGTPGGEQRDVHLIMPGAAHSHYYCGTVSSSVFLPFNEAAGMSLLIKTASSSLLSVYFIMSAMQKY